MKKNRYGLCVTAVAVVLVGIQIFLYGLPRIPHQYAERIREFEDGDFVYRYQAEDLVLDEELQTLYVQNIINVYAEDIFSKSERQQLAELVDGTVVSDISGSVNMIQILVQDSTLQQIKQMAEQLMESEIVAYACYEVPMFLGESSTESNPWCEEGDALSNEIDIETPGGNNWWAEAIDAYAAWEYEDLFQDVTVGVLDTGFDVNHVDLQGRISILGEHSRHEHGTEVVGVLGALNNDIGLRGVASGAAGSDNLHIICADWTPYLNETVDLGWFGTWEAEEKAINALYVNYLATGEYIKIIEQLVQGDYFDKTDGAVVINCSWGRVLNWEKWEKLFTSDEYQKNRIDVYQEANVQMARQCTWMMLQMLFRGEDFLIVQAAGNEETSALISGAFARIANDVFMDCTIDGEWNGLTYKDIDERILIVGAVENTRDSEGNYKRSGFSNYGINVDICAPGTDIFTTTIGGYTNVNGTSLAAPIVAGSAALLWSIDPDLSAPEVRKLLLENTKYHDYASDESTGTSKMLNIGMAVKALIQQKNYEEATEITAKADDNTLLYSKLEELVNTYGIIATGTEEFPCEPALGEMDISVPAGRITGLLFADIFDYDGDGEDELMALRLEAQEAKEVWNEVAGKAVLEVDETQIYVEMYDYTADGLVREVQLADSLTIPYSGLMEALYSSSIHVFRGNNGKYTNLYLDYYYHMNSQSFGVAEITYEGGTLSVTGGMGCSEFAASAVCDLMMTKEALGSLLGRQRFIERNGWMDGVWYDTEEMTDMEEVERIYDNYREEYQKVLSAIGLHEVDSRTNKDEEDISVQSIYGDCYSRPLEHYEVIRENLVLTELGGVISPYAQGGVTLTCYDNTGWLDAYRN